MRLEQIIHSPILSEKAYSLAGQNVYVLKVDIKATKKEIAQAIQKIYEVDVISVNTSITRGKIVRKARSKKSSPIDVKLPNIKKAFVKIKQGQKIALVANET